MMAIVGDTVTMEKKFLAELLKDVSGIAASTAVDKYREEKMSGEKLSVEEVSKELKLSTQTLIRYIHAGKKVRGRYVKLKAEKNGRQFSISRLDMEEFRKSING
jgi:IS30 family transposase